MKARMILVMMLVAAPLSAQSGRLDLRFDHLSEKAAEWVDVNLDGAVLKLAAQFLSTEDRDLRKVREAITGVTAIYVRNFQFDTTGSYSPADVQKVRSQLDSTWQRVVTVREKGGDNVEIYMRPTQTGSRGLVIIAAEPKEFTVVQVVGDIDLERIADREGQFGIPSRISVKRKP
jgi:hypothetical protein